MFDDLDFGSEDDPEKIKILVRDYLDRKADSFSAALRAALPLYALHDFAVFCVSHDNRAEIRFTKKPTHKEIEALIGFLFVQSDALKENDGIAA